MRKLKEAIIKIPILGRTLFIVYRAKTAVGYFRRPLSDLFKWLFKSKEITNFTYDLEASNIRYLASLIADSLIDIFVNDSDHSASYEAEEYKTIENKLSENAIILGDNAHCTDTLLDFSLKTNRHFIFFQEKPVDHWYPGAGIGISFRR